MAVPLVRRYTAIFGAVAGVTVNATDDVTNQVVLQLSNDNVVEDMVNSPDPANLGGDQIRTQLFVNQLEAGPAFFSVSSSPTTAGRQPIGPIPISAQGGKQVSYRCTVDNTVTALPYNYSFQIRYRNLFT